MSLYSRIWVSENSYSGLFYAVITVTLKFETSTCSFFRLSISKQFLFFTIGNRSATHDNYWLFVWTVSVILSTDVLGLT